MPRKNDNLYNIVERLKGDVGRLRLLVPFPVNREDFYRVCLPAEFWEAIYHPSVQGMNAQRLTETGDHVHFCFMSPEKYQQVADTALVSEFEQVFWIDLPEDTICPDPMSMSPLIVPKEHLFYRDVQKWYGEAAAMQKVMKTYIDMLESVFETFEDAVELAGVWSDLPKLANAKLPKRLRSIEPKRQKQLQRFMDKVGVGVRTRFANDMLSASLLPQDAEPTAWVDWR